MNLTTLGPLAFGLGLLGLAAVLFALQRLRVRHEELPVVTTLFWREAVEESRARVLTERFRHPWAYLLALAIAGLLWFAVAAPRLLDDVGRHYTVLLDGSAGMALVDADGGARFDRARAAALEIAAQLPRERTDVVWCGASPRTLLAAGEAGALLERRMDGLAPEAAPASIERALRQVAVEAQDELGRTVVVVGDGPVAADLIERLPGQIEVRRAELPAVAGAGVGIVALGVSPAASGTWTRVDVLVELAGEGAPGAELSASLDGVALVAGDGLHGSMDRSSAAPDRSQLLLRDLPADGGRLELRLGSGDATPLDDVARLDLPRRPRIRVDVDPGLEAIAAVLAADDAVLLVAPGAASDLRVVRGDGEVDGPALVLASSELQEEAILLTHREGLDSGAALRAALGELGLDRIDATELASRAGRAISVGARPGPERQVALWEELLDPERFDLVESRAFPVLVARSVRWLADQDPFLPYLAADRPLPRRLADPRPQLTWQLAPVPAVAGELQLADGSTHAVSLFDQSATSLQPADLAGVVTAPDGFDAVTWILLLALALTALEWWLVRRGRMP
ncbi:VWA domain-containing protein [Engelhardtia mirabilis]|uniref:VWFA domain-containing protein n=1 Tax=Engelhardtia mirabilis TaxID=2528011 RepID=A0A518BGM9_9BACT|nr:hypothetical protein Pla133_11970 [Planctomycetes bacterium Pla133]QDV00458.1 hypothetical protein Pla86_11970 [Planctomycetes bacterium Pla86]